jgi:hypothetical protein
MKGVGGMVDPKNRHPVEDTGLKGPISQRRLAKMLPVLVDLATAKAASKTRDDARQVLRETLAVANWRTPYIMRALRVKRCRKLAAMGYVIDTKYLGPDPGSIENLNQWNLRHG